MRASSDLVSGLLLVVVGIAALSHSYIHYELGSLSRMGAGFFPALIGGLLAIIGFALIFLGLASKAADNDIKPASPRALLAVCSAIIGFGLALESLGLLPATILLALLSSAAVKRFNLKQSLMIGASLGILAWLIFVVGLDMSISLVMTSE